jgi:CRISPR/Cas system-associated exonuclease Cas4 (RecB family)
VTPRQLTVGQRRAVVARVRLSNNRPFVRARVLVVAPGVRKSALTNRQGIARIVVKATRPGIARVTVMGNPRCTARRVGIVGVFQPPLTG